MSPLSRRPFVVEAPAKINLHLEVLGKRPDGYHELESLMVTVSLADILTFESAKTGTVVKCDEPRVGPEDDNLVSRAVKLVREESGREDGVEITLTKRTPVAAGLGGGSSDAAATLRGLNEWWELGWSNDRLAELGARLGSDVPFFFYPPAAIVRGRGELVTPVPMATKLDVVLVTPTDRLSTRTVFGNLVPGRDVVPVESIADALARGDIPGIARRLHNRLQDVSTRLSPAVRNIQDQAKTWSCLGHLMTGSGSTYFALCESQVQAESLGKHLQELELGLVFVVRSG